MNQNSSDSKATEQLTVLPNWLYKFIDIWSRILGFGGAAVFLFGGSFAKVLAILMIGLAVVLFVRQRGLNSIKNDIKAFYDEVFYRIARIDNLKITLYTTILFLGIILVTILGDYGFFKPITEKLIFLKTAIKDVIDIAFGNIAHDDHYLQSISVSLLILSTLVIFQILSSLGASNSVPPDGYIKVFDIYISGLLNERWSDFLQWIQTQNRQSIMPYNLKEIMEPDWRRAGLENDFKRTVEAFLSLSKELEFNCFSSGTVKISISSSQALKHLKKKNTCVILAYALEKYIEHELLGIKYPKASYDLFSSKPSEPLIRQVSLNIV